MFIISIPCCLLPANVESPGSVKFAGVSCVPTARLKPMPAPTSSALMRSDSDLDSDDGQNVVPWKEQERGHLLRPQNGSLRNGQVPARSKKQREELL